MGEVFKVVFYGYEIQVGAQVLEDGGYAPTLLVCRDCKGFREGFLVSVPCLGAFLTPEQAKEQALEHGMRWVKDWVDQI